jgi:hypothetical protein
MNSSERKSLLDMFSTLCDGELSAEHGQQLASALRSNPEARVAYVRYFDVHASLDRDAAVRLTAFDLLAQRHDQDREVAGAAALCSAHSSVQSSAQSVCRAPASERLNERVHWPSTLSQRGESLRWQKIGYVAVALLVGLVAWQLAEPERDRSRPFAGRVVANIISDADCEWIGLAESNAQRRRLRTGQQLMLTSGVARLRFVDDTVVLVESPTRFEPVSESELRLHSGTVALRANGVKKDFTVLAPDASIVDRGTSFGVHSGPEGIDIEVFEGKVEVLPSNDAKRSQVLGLGASARVKKENGQTDINMFGGDEGRFTDLLQMLWEDMHQRQPDQHGETIPSKADHVFPFQEFSASQPSTAVDLFHGAASGRGWVTPWVASGNPIGEVTDSNPLFGPGNSYLRLNFNQSLLRTVAREYGATDWFDPTQPHVISWLWRFDGQDEDFGNSFQDRIAFYGNEYFRANSSNDVTWFIGWAGDHETTGEQRKAIPKRWYVFDGANGSEFDPSNLVDTGMTLKPGVVYRMAVVLYPLSKQYDAIIQDDQQTFVRARLGYRNPTGHAARVLHFSVGNEPIDGDAAFSIDSIRVEPLRPDLIPHDLRFNVPTDPASDSSLTGAATNQLSPSR